jgi:hypothetical protein
MSINYLCRVFGYFSSSSTHLRLLTVAVESHGGKGCKGEIESVEISVSVSHREGCIMLGQHLLKRGELLRFEASKQDTFPVRSLDSSHGRK